MLKIEPPNYQFCPFCGQKLKVKTEEGKEWKFCSVCNWTYYPHVAAAVGAVMVRNGKALLVKRAREPYKDTWMFPAGFVDFGEHPEDTLKREVREETGLKIKNFELKLIWQTDDDPRSPGHFFIGYKVSVEGEELKTDKDENQAIGWFEIATPPPIGWKAHQYILKLLQKGEF